MFRGVTSLVTNGSVSASDPTLSSNRQSLQAHPVQCTPVSVFERLDVVSIHYVVKMSFPLLVWNIVN